MNPMVDILRRKAVIVYSGKTHDWFFIKPMRFNLRVDAFEEFC